ncbi:MAG: EF-Tu/IF-2/RF-3 family GTPase, partial [Nitrospiraceae bacterium]
LDTILDQIPAPAVNAEAPLQILVLALAQDSYKGKMGIGKIQSGSIAKRQSVVQIRRDGTRASGKVTDLAVFAGLERAEVDKAEAGEIVAVAGLPDIGIGETIADADQPVALPPVAIDEPTVQMTFGVNNSPFAGREGKYLTSRHLRERLFKELETNVSLRVEETDSPDRFLVAGRGELHLAVLIEQMRREGYELQVSQPEVILHTEEGVVTEPYEELTIEVPSEYQGAVIEEVGRRRGELRHMKVLQGEGAASDTHLGYHIPTRGVLGLKNVLLAKARGTVIMHHVFHRYEPVDKRAPMTASHGSLVAYEDGTSNAYGLYMIQERGSLFIEPGVDVYRGMV